MLSYHQLSIDSAHYNWLGRCTWQPLLKNISFSFNRGELVALVGASGEGKSLLLQATLALLPNNLRTQGTIRLDERILSSDEQRNLRGNTLCYLPQGVDAMNPLLKVGQQLKRIAHLTGHRHDYHHLTHHLEQYQLSSATYHLYPRQLSGGMAKRLLACTPALAHPEFILADEITAWLDEPRATHLLNQLRELCHRGCGVLWVTHDLALASHYADRIVVLDEGQVRETLSTEDLRSGQGSQRLRSEWQALPEHGRWREAILENEYA